MIRWKGLIRGTGPTSGRQARGASPALACHLPPHHAFLRHACHQLARAVEDPPAVVICPLSSGLISMLELATKEEWNGKEAHGLLSAN